MTNILNTGCILNDRYEVIDLLETVENETIYLIEDLHHPQEPLALKEFISTPKKKIVASPEFVNRAAALSEVRHPNLVKLFDFFVEVPEEHKDERYYIVMEYVEGRTLLEIFQKDLREEPLPTKMLLKQMVKVCGALKHLNNQHPSPIAFGVLNPKNIILTPERQIKLFNYGLGSLLKNNYYSKTGGFISPEQIDKGIIDEKSDVFSLGATIYYLLTGKNPEKDPMNFKSILEFNKNVNPGLNKIILKCISENPDERPDLQQVSNFLLNSYIGKRPSSKIYTPKPPVQPKEGKVITKDYLVKIEESKLQEPKKDVFKLSKSTFHLPSKERSKDERPAAPENIRLGTKPKFQKIVKRGTRRIDPKLALAARKAFAKKDKGLADIDTAAKKAKDSIKKSTGLLEKLAKSRELEKKEKKIVSPEKEEVKKEATILVTEETGDKEKTTIPVIEETGDKKEEPQEETGDKKEEPQEETGEGKKALSLAQKLALKYAKKKKEEEYAEDAEDTKDKKSGIRFETGNLGLSSEWREQKLAQCELKPNTPPILEPLKEGSIIKNRYEIAEVVNKDCYGAVYMAFDKEAVEEEDPVVGIKEIQYKPPSDNHKLGEKIIANFVRLASKLQKLDHPNLVNIKDYFFSYSGDRSAIRLFLVMEFIEGYTLEEVIKTHQQKESKMPSTTIFAMVTKVCDALDYLHNLSPVRIHGDLKPENIIISYNGEIKLIKYTLREIFLIDNELVHPVHGTLGYFAPEQTGIDFKNTKADIFALGAIMYYLLTGKNPEENPYDFVPVKQINPYISPNVEEVIKQCVRINPLPRLDINFLKEKLSKISLVELDSSLLEKQKEIKEKRKASMEEINQLQPMGAAFGILVLKYFAAVVAVICLVIGGIKLVDYLTHRPTQGEKLYIISGTEKAIKEIDTKTYRVTKTIPLKSSATSIVGSSVSKKVFISDKSTVYIMSTIGKKLTTYFNAEIDVSSIITSPDGAKLYLISRKDNMLKGFDVNSQNFLGEVKIPRGSITGCISPDGSKSYIINDYQEESFLTIIDLTNFKISKKISINESSTDIVVAKNGETAFITHKELDLVSIVNLTSGQIKTLSTNTKGGLEKAQPISLVINNNNKVYIINQLLKNMVILRTSDMAIGETIDLKAHPSLIASSGDKLYIYTIDVVGIKREYKIKVIDTATNNISEEIILEKPIIGMTISED